VGSYGSCLANKPTGHSESQLRPVVNEFWKFVAFGQSPLDPNSWPLLEVLL